MNEIARVFDCVNKNVEIVVGTVEDDTLLYIIINGKDAIFDMLENYDVVVEFKIHGTSKKDLSYKIETGDFSLESNEIYIIEYYNEEVTESKAVIFIHLMMT